MIDNIQTSSKDFLLASFRSSQLDLFPVAAPHSPAENAAPDPVLSDPAQLDGVPPAPRFSMPLPMIADESGQRHGHAHSHVHARDEAGGISLGCSCCAHTAMPDAALSGASPGRLGWKARLGGFDVAARSPAALALAAVLGIVGWLISLSRDTPAGHNSLLVVLYASVVLVGGWPLLRGAGRAWKAHSLDMNALMSAAVLGACALGEWGEAAALVWLYALADKVEARSLSRARHAITSLLSLAPSRVLVRRFDGKSQGELLEIDAAAVQVGEIFIARAGERVALDGVLISNHAQLDESPVTGEALPLEKRAGDEVLAGTLNVGHALEARALRLASEGTSARIARLVEEAGAQASPRQRATERFARVYTPVVFGGAVMLALVPPLGFGAPWEASVYRALALLVAACPCAFVLSGPVVTWCALATLSRRGVLARGGAALESLAAAKVFAFDKTGTLTRGTPVVTDFRLFPGANLPREAAIALAAGLEARSTHPLARAVLGLAAREGIAPAPVADTSEQRGVGVGGTVNGEHFRIERWDENVKPGEFFDAEMVAAVTALREQGRSLALLWRDLDGANQPLALLGFADEVRPEARAVLDELRRLGARELVILSGDHAGAVEQVAREVGASAWHADLKPAAKLDAVRALERGDLERSGRALAMVGDGINDAPALAGASVGVAMGHHGGAAASDIALEAAGVALLRDDLRLLPAAVRLARRANRVVGANIALALGLKGSFVLGVLFGVWGHDYLVGGVISDVGASLLVTLNGLRLLQAEKPRV